MSMVNFKDAESLEDKIYYVDLKEDISFKTVKGQVVTNGINEKMFGETKVFSIGLKLTDQLVLPLLAEVLDLPAEYEVRPFLKNELLFLKLRQRGGKFAFASDIPMNVNNVSKIAINRLQTIQVEIIVKAYVDTIGKVAGYMFDIVKVNTKNIK